MDFKRLSVDDVNLIRPFFESSGLTACDYSVGGVFLWRDFFDTHYAITDDTLVFRYKYFGGIDSFSVPIGKSCSSVYSAISKLGNETVNFCAVPSERIDCIKKAYSNFEISATASRDWFDYLYEPQSFITFSGKKFSAKRNHINKFRSLYSDWSVKEMTEDDIPNIRDFLSTLPSNDESELSVAESSALNELLYNWSIYRFKGLILFVNGKIAAFSVGDIIGDVLFVHFEKANTEITGSYTVIANEFARAYANGVKFINREEDMGLLGLRQSKLSYNPVAFSEKYDITVKLK